jgi:hypothetical protein
LSGGLEETRLIDERFASVMGECVNVTLKVCRLYSKSGYWRRTTGRDRRRRRRRSNNIRYSRTMLMSLIFFISSTGV